MISKESSSLIAAADNIREDDAYAHEVGEELAKIMCLRRYKGFNADRWYTTWGSKTSAGLARTVLSIIEKRGE